MITGESGGKRGRRHEEEGGGTREGATRHERGVAKSAATRAAPRTGEKAR